MFKGSVVALVTPFDEEKKIDKKALEDLVLWHIERGTDAIVCTGTTGECSTLTNDEKLEVLQICLSVANKKIPIISGTGTNDTMQTCFLTRKAKEYGAAGVLVVAPYYNKPSQEGLYAHYMEIAKIGAPVIVYHHPGRTGVTIEIDTFEKISKLDNIVAIKEASGDLLFVEKLLKKTSLPILSGDDLLTVEIMKRGGAGVISVVANIIPSIWKQLTKLCELNNFEEAGSLLEKHRNICDVMFLETNPQCVKYALSLMGRVKSIFRLPLLEPSIKNKKQLLAVLTKYKSM